MRPSLSRCLAVLALVSLGACAGQGGKVFVREGCVNCHRFKGRGGGPGPALDGVGSRLSGTAIRAQISNPGRTHPLIASEYFRAPLDVDGGLFPQRRLTLMRGSHPRQHAPDSPSQSGRGSGGGEDIVV